MTQEKNPIKHVKFSEMDYVEPLQNNGRNPKKKFKEVTIEFQQALATSLDQVAQQLTENIPQGWDGISGAAVVELEEKAIAKSHRPTSLFNEKTCPFFGDIGFTKFLIEVSPEKIQALTQRILNISSANANAIAELSTVKSIRSYKPEVLITQDSRSLSIKLFRFEDQDKNRLIDHHFEQFLIQNEVAWTKHPSEVIRIYQVKTTNQAFIETLLKLRVVSRVVSSDSIKLSPTMLSGFAVGQPTVSYPENREYPVVAVVDTGVNLDCPYLAPWIVGCESYVSYNRDLKHGSFVSGLISNAKPLNGNDQRFPTSQSKVLNVEVLGKEGGDCHEIIEAMYDVAKKKPGIKVWNLSLGESLPVSMEHISEMALMLDEFQQRHDCLCVVSAGNYEGNPLRNWPPADGLNDGVSSPGDSVKSLTVGSLAHVDGFVKTDEPSHFSRKGPVSNYIQKPEVMHYGGNALFHISPPVMLGVNSISYDSRLMQDIGTSFSTPLISTIAANLFYRIGARATPCLIKSLLIHSAHLRNTIPVEYKHYYGWGIPDDVDEILSANDHEMTVVLEGQASKSFNVQKLPFPIPNCLRTADGKVRAEFFVTLVYDTPLEPEKAFEYCQVNLNVGLGKYSETGKFNSMVPLDTEGHGYEKDQIKNGLKWAPVKVYKKRFSQGVDVRDWKLNVTMKNRDGFEPEGVLIPFSLVITLRDIDGTQPVYNEMSQLMDQYNWEVSDLVVEQKIRV